MVVKLCKTAEALRIEGIAESGRAVRHGIGSRVAESSEGGEARKDYHQVISWAVSRGKGPWRAGRKPKEPKGLIAVRKTLTSGKNEIEKGKARADAKNDERRKR